MTYSLFDTKIPREELESSFNITEMIIIPEEVK